MCRSVPKSIVLIWVCSSLQQFLRKSHTMRDFSPRLDNGAMETNISQCQLLQAAGSQAQVPTVTTRNEKRMKRLLQLLYKNSTHCMMVTAKETQFQGEKDHMVRGSSEIAQRHTILHWTKLAMKLYHQIWEAEKKEKKVRRVLTLTQSKSPASAAFSNELPNPLLLAG